MLFLGESWAGLCCIKIGDVIGGGIQVTIFDKAGRHVQDAQGKKLHCKPLKMTLPWGESQTDIQNKVPLPCDVITCEICQNHSTQVVNHGGCSNLWPLSRA